MVKSLVGFRHSTSSHQDVTWQIASARLAKDVWCTAAPVLSGQWTRYHPGGSLTKQSDQMVFPCACQTVLCRFKITSYAKSSGSHLVQESSPQPLGVGQDAQTHSAMLQGWIFQNVWTPAPITDHLHYGIFLVLSNWNFSCCDLCPLPLIQSLHTPKMNVHLLHTLPAPSWRQNINSPLSLFFHKQN